MYLFLTDVRAGDIVSGYDSVLLDNVARGEGSAPEINVPTSARISELGTYTWYFVGYKHYPPAYLL